MLEIPATKHISDDSHVECLGCDEIGCLAECCPDASQAYAYGDGHMHDACADRRIKVELESLIFERLEFFLRADPYHVQDEKDIAEMLTKQIVAKYIVRPR